MHNQNDHTIEIARQDLAALSSPTPSHLPSDRGRTAPPEQYAIGYTEFFGLQFISDARALIPRFETEFIVKETVRWCKAHGPEMAWNIADVGTGSGVVAVSIALQLPRANVIASDISADALALATENAVRHRVDRRIRFVQGSLLGPFTEPPDIIVANLPYLPTARIATLDPSVCDWEPHDALDGGEDGFDLYRQLFAQISRMPLPNCPKLAILEIDHNQKAVAERELIRYFPEASHKILPDTSGLIRYITLHFNS